MSIQINTNFDDCKSLDDLKRELNSRLEQLQNQLNNRPDFIVVPNADDFEIPKNTPTNTIIFQFDETDIVKTGYYDGENIVLP
jgi:hypothetical protein